MNLNDIRQKLYRDGRLTRMGWLSVAIFIIFYMAMKHSARDRRERALHTSQVTANTSLPEAPKMNVKIQPTLAESPLPLSAFVQPTHNQQNATPSRQYNQPSFGNFNTSGKILSDDFLPKGTILYATLTSDIVSNNQVSPATATIITPAIFAHSVRIPVGTHITGRIAPGNLRGRVFVTWDTLIFYEEGRQGWELPIKGIGMTYEQNPQSGRWLINGAGLKGYLYDDSASIAFKLAGLKAAEDFAKTLQSFVTTQNSSVSSGSVVTTTTTTPQATLQNSGLGAAAGFIDVIAQRYQANLQQQNSYVLVPTARLCAIFLDEPIDITAAAPGRSMQTGK